MKVLLALLVASAASVLLWSTADSGGHGRITALGDRTSAEIDEERVLGRVARPVIRGEPLDADASELYRRLDPALTLAEAEALSDAHLGAIGSSSRALVASKAGVLRDLHAALRSKRCDWGFLGGDIEAATTALELRLWHLGELLLVEAFDRRERGDRAGAAVVYLEAVRFGADLAGPGTAMNLVPQGAAVAVLALEGLGELVASGPRGELPVPDLRAALDALEKLLPDARRLERIHRLQVTSWMAACLAKDPSGRTFLRTTGLTEPAWLPYVPSGVYYSRELEAFDAIARDRERLATLRDANERRALHARIVSEADGRVGFARRLVSKHFEPPPWSEEIPARLALIRAAIALEEAFARDRAYPASPELPPDPASATGAPLRHRRTPAGYEVASTAAPSGWQEDDYGVTNTGAIPGTGIAVERR